MKEFRFNYNQITPPRIQEGLEINVIPNRRQQDKIIAILNSGNYDLISENRVSVGDNERENFLQRLARGK